MDDDEVTTRAIAAYEQIGVSDDKRRDIEVSVIADAIRDAVAAAVERCAKVAEGMIELSPSEAGTHTDGWNDAAGWVAERIREGK